MSSRANGPSQPRPFAARVRSAWREPRLDWAIGVAALVVYALAQLWLLQGPQPFDPGYYFETAVDFPHVSSDYYTLRIGVVGFVLPGVLLFGASEASLYAVPFAAGLLLVAAVYGTTLLLFRDRVVAGAASLVAALNPTYLLNSSFIFPDTVATATFAAGIFCLVLGATRPADDERRWLPAAAAGAAGFFFGWTYLAREFSPILLPVVLVGFVLLRYPLRRVAVVAAAALATFALELVYGLVGFGDPFLHLRVLLAKPDLPLRPGRAALMEHLRGQIEGPLDSLAVFPRLLLSWETGWAFLALTALFVVSLLLVRDRRLWLVGAWFLAVWTILVVLGLVWVRPGQLVLNVTNIRYWYPIFPALAIGAFGGLALLLRRAVPGRAAVVVPLAAAALAAATVVPGTIEFRNCAARDVWLNQPFERWRELRAWLATSEAARYDVIWTDRWSVRIVPAYASTPFGRQLWGGRVEALAYYPEEDPFADRRALVLVNFDDRRFVNPKSGTRLAEARRRAEPVFTSADGALVLLASRGASGGSPAADATWSRVEPATRGEPGRCGVRPYGSQA